MRPPRLLPVLAAGALVLAACGDDDTSEPSDTLAIQAEAGADTGAGAGADGGSDGSSDAPAPEAEIPPEASDDGASVDDTGSADAESGGDEAPAGEQPAADDAPAEEPAADEAAAPSIRSTRLDDGRIDLLGPDVDAAADVESNPLPSVVVDDIQTGAKVNFRNVAPQNLPILLWMWAPH